MRVARSAVSATRWRWSPVGCPRLRARLLGLFEAPVRIGARSVVSQYAMIATWRLEGGPGRSDHRLVAPVTPGDDAWVATETHVDAGSFSEDGARVGARSVGRGRVPGWTIAAGDPLRVRDPRRLAGPEAGRESASVSASASGAATTTAPAGAPEEHGP